MIGVTAENRLPARLTLQITGLTAENRLSSFLHSFRFYILIQAGKQFSAVTPVICKACQVGNQSSARLPA
jgi:hypothetical protein